MIEYIVWLNLGTRSVFGVTVFAMNEDMAEKVGKLLIDNAPVTVPDEYGGPTDKLNITVMRRMFADPDEKETTDD